MFALSKYMFWIKKYEKPVIDTWLPNVLLLINYQLFNKKVEQLKVDQHKIDQLQVDQQLLNN